LDFSPHDDEQRAYHAPSLVESRATGETRRQGLPCTALVAGENFRGSREAFRHTRSAAG